MFPSCSRRKVVRGGLMTLLGMACAALLMVGAPQRARAFTDPTIDHVTGLPSTVSPGQHYDFRIYLTDEAPADSFAQVTGTFGISGGIVNITQGASYIDVGFNTFEEGGFGQGTLGFGVGKYVTTCSGPQNNVTDSDQSSFIWGE